MIESKVPVQADFNGEDSQSDHYDNEDAEYELDGDQSFEDDSNVKVEEEDGLLHEKRKAMLQPEDTSHAASKRQEVQVPPPKKAGRKLATTEPMTKRKAQNRAAQRAFRERKERHLKDLETKIEQLESASETTNHENGRLREQVDRLNTEVAEYRRRISLNTTAASFSPLSATSSQVAYDKAIQSNELHFSFPKFGNLTRANMSENVLPPSQKSTTKVLPLAITASPMSSPPLHIHLSTIQPSPESTAEVQQFSSIKSPAIVSPEAVSSTRSCPDDDVSVRNIGVKTGSGNPMPITTKISRLSSASFTNSPTSSISQTGFESSAGTTPEPTMLSPESRQTSLGSGAKDYSTGDAPRNPPSDATISPQSLTMPYADYKLFDSLTTGTNELNGIDWMARQNGGQFDPILFGDYRDPQNNTLSNVTLDDDFFSDALPLQDFSSPFNTVGYNTDVIDPNVLSQDFSIDGNKCNPTTASEEHHDIDSLCSQFKAKAKCSAHQAKLAQELFGVHSQVQ